MNIGYSYWGFLADVKMNNKLEQLSTPDGNAFYSWSIIKELQARGNNVYSIMPDRDKYAVTTLGKDAFDAWATDDRYDTYSKMNHIEYSIDWKNAIMNDLFKIWDNYKFEYIIHEWRMPIEGRNTINAKSNVDWQPDLFIQMCLLRYCKLHSIKLFIFDLDYKLKASNIIDKENTIILELGTKWEKSKIKSHKVYIPFDFNHINDFEIKSFDERNTNLIYIGNRYERDWCIDKYIPENFDNVVIHGNWKEGGRDSVEKWPRLDFRKRLQTSEMHDAYSNSVCTILLAKKDYCKYNFMTARIIEAIFYGTIPLFIQEYGFDTIHEYAGKYSMILTVHNKQDVINAITQIKQSSTEYNDIIQYLRDRLSKMDATYFINVLEEYL